MQDAQAMQIGFDGLLIYRLAAGLGTRTEVAREAGDHAAAPDGPEIHQPAASKRRFTAW